MSATSSAVPNNGSAQGVVHSNANSQNGAVVTDRAEKANETDEDRSNNGKCVRHVIKLHGSIICALHGSRCMAYQNRQ